MTTYIERSTSCRACKSSDLKPRFSANGYTLDECRSCSFVQVRERPTAEVLDKIYGEQYFTHSKYQDQQTLAVEVERRMALLGRFVPARARVLDAGCAIGDFVAAANRQYDAYGMDRSPFAIEVAVEKHPELAGRVWSGFLEDMPATEAGYDAICLWDVIEHVWDPVATLQTLLQHLKPGGILLLSTPSIDAPIARLMGRYWAFMTPPEHLGFFTGKSFKAVFDGPAPAQIVHRARRGKTANVGFVFYKARRVLPALVPQWLVNFVSNGPLGKRSIYVPTGDIQYVLAQKAE